VKVEDKEMWHRVDTIGKVVDIHRKYVCVSKTQEKDDEEQRKHSLNPVADPCTGIEVSCTVRKEPHCPPHGTGA
jgi:hypothetical protein